MMIETNDSFRLFQTKLNYSDSFYICLIFSILMATGLINLYSATVNLSYFPQQLKYTVVGLVSLVICSRFVSVRFLEAVTYPIFVISLAALVLVLFFGYSAGGAQRWLMLGPIRVQPSEFAKITTILFIAKFFHMKKQYYYTVYELWPVLFSLMAVFIVIFKQPDFGTAGLCLIIGVCQLLFVNITASRRLVFFLIFLIVGSAVIGWNFFLHTYQKLRILNLFNPELDPSGSGYNSIQSLVAVGSGQFWGKGFLQGTQTQLQFLPARHTDFIFSVVAEEQGFWVCCLIFVLFYLLSAIGMNIAKRSQDIFKLLTAVGCSAFIFIEFVINIAMVLGLFPVVGMPLPFFSYGGSSLLTICIAVGILISIDRSNRERVSN